MMKRGSRQNQSIQQGDGDANIDARFKRAKHAACSRAVNIQLVADSAIRRWDHYWLSIGDESDMTNKSLIEDGIHRLPVKLAALRQALQCCSFSLGKRTHRIITPGSLTLVS